MRKLAAFLVLALFAGCASADNTVDEDRRRGAPGESAGKGGTTAAAGASGASAKGGGAGTKAKGGEGGAEATSGAGGESSGGAGAEAGGDAGTSGTAGTASAAGKGGAAGAANPCAGVACNAPPARTCASETELEVFTAPGSCNEGDCKYASSKIACEKGCKDDACVGNPCLGVSCNEPAAASCIGPQELLAYDAGTCSDGTCTYPDKKIFCQFGCEAGACKGNPCSGKICGLPPASFCSAADKLSVFESVGTCDNVTGSCAYAKEEKFCEFGCVNGSCKGDPCVGVSCTTPPASSCADAQTKKVAVSPGACAAGSCTYTTVDQKCLFGCTKGVCKDCAADADCTGGGKFCDNGTCRACDGDLHCGASCTNCVTSSQICSAGACVACVNDAQCGAGKFCEGNACKSCDTSAKCGASCAACGATTPTCAGGTTCSCTETSCGANNKCVTGACSFCDRADSCGATCAPCGGTTPVCKASGATSACVECTTNEQCGAGKTCTPDNKCVAGCPPPAEACVNGNQSRDNCAGARIISRTNASAGYAISSNTCSASNRKDESGSCWSAGSDHMYRLYMRKGESAKITLNVGDACFYSDSPFWNSTLMVFQPAGCAQGVLPAYSGCGTRTFCEKYFNNSNTTYVAPEDGWVVVVVDGSTYFDDEGDYTLLVKLTCSTGNCECP